MAKFIELLNTEFPALPAQFTVDNTVPEVASGIPAAGQDYATPAGLKWFEMGDNVVLTGISINLPYQFGQGTGNPFINVVWRDAGGADTLIPELSGSSNLFFPTVCGMLELPPDGIFIKAPIVGGKRKLVMTAVTLNISMLNVPTLINGAVLDIGSSLRLFHTRALTAVP